MPSLYRTKRPFLILLIWSIAVFWTADCVAKDSTEAQPTVVPITSNNRHYPGIMFGGWGPHLRALMRAPDGSLWLAIDEGPDVQHNEQVVYYTFDRDRWREASGQNQISGIQQNVASVMVGSKIFSYGVAIRGPHYIEECTFDTLHPERNSSLPVEVGGTNLLIQDNSNYIGAVVTPGGGRLVWWTTVGENGAEGLFSYICQSGDVWHGPVVTRLRGYNDFGYVFAAFDGNKVALAGQLYRGAYPHGSYALGCAEFKLGEKLRLSSLEPAGPQSGQSASDIWVQHGAAHVIAETHQGSLACYYKPAGEDWSQVKAPYCNLPGVFRARFLDSGDTLWLVTGGATNEGVALRRVPKRTINGPIDWPRIAPILVPSSTPGLEAPSAIYVESANYQTTPVLGVNLAVVGKYPDFDNEIWHVLTSRKSSVIHRSP